MSNRRGGDDLGLSGVSAVEKRGEATMAHDGDAVGERHDLVEVGCNEDNSDPLRGQAPHDAEHVGFGADVDAAS